MYIIRHGETELNLIRAFQGHTDSPLTSTGIRQAEIHASRLKSLGLTHIISSDLPRAIDTATIIAEHLNLPIETDPKLQEVWFGCWDGMSDANIRQQYPAMWEEREHEKWQFNAYIGESYAMAYQRACDWLAGHHQSGHLIVCHRTFGKILRGAYTGLTPDAVMATDFLHTDIFRMYEGKSIRTHKCFLI